MHPDAPNWGSFKPAGDSSKDRDKPVSIWLYLGILIFSSAVCAAGAYFVLLLTMPRRPHTYSFPAWWESDAMKGVTGDQVIAVTGLIGAAIGFVIGLVICIRIKRDEIAERKELSKPMPPKKHPFETPLEP